MTATGVPLPISYTGRESFSRYVIQTNATRILVNALNDLPLNANAGVNSIGVLVNGVNQGSGMQLGNQGFISQLSFALPPGTNTIELFDGACSEVVAGTPPIRYMPVLSYAIPHGSSHTVLVPTAPAKRYVVLGDSVTMGFYVNAGPGQAAPYQAWTMLMRAHALASSSGTMAGARVNNAGNGGRAWADDAGSPTLITQSVARLTTQLDGTSLNVLIGQMGINDYAAGTSAATTQSNVGDWADAVHAALPSVTIVLVSMLITTTEGTPNAGGSTPPQCRAALQNVATARPGFVKFIDGLTLIPANNPTYFAPDGIHLTTFGMATNEANERTGLNTLGVGY